MKTKPVKARLFSEEQFCDPRLTAPQWCLPATKAAYRQMVEQVDAAITKSINGWLAGDKASCAHAPRRVLSAIGIKEAKP